MNEILVAWMYLIISPLLVAGFAFHRRRLLEVQRFNGPIENS
jgi:hypothetical protein